MGLLDSPPSYPDHGDDDDDDGDDASDDDDDGDGDDGDGDDENRKLISEVETIGSEWPLLPTDPLYGSMCTALSSSDDHHRCIYNHHPMIIIQFNLSIISDTIPLGPCRPLAAWA